MGDSCVTTIKAIALAMLACLVMAPVAAAAQPAPTARVAQPATPASSTDPAYRINPGDELEVFVWGEERLQKQVRVLPDGSFTFPLVGRIEAAGRLPSEIEAIVTAGLAPQYRGAVPTVTVSVATSAGLQFSVMGRVRNPGSFTTQRYLTVLEALSMAGGPTEFAELGNVIVLRREGNETRMIRLRLQNVLRGTPSAADLAASGMEIRAGDTVVVP